MAEIEDPTIGMTRDLKPTAECRVSSCMKTFQKWLLEMALCPMVPPPDVNMRTKLCLSAYA